MRWRTDSRLARQQSRLDQQRQERGHLGLGLVTGHVKTGDDDVDKPGECPRRFAGEHEEAGRFVELVDARVVRRDGHDLVAQRAQREVRRLAVGAREGFHGGR